MTDDRVVTDVDLTAYFARIGYRGPADPTGGVLAELVAAHNRSIPFENLDPVFGVPVFDLGAAALMDKIRLAVEGVAEQSEAFDPQAIDDEDLQGEAIDKIIDLSAELRATHTPLVAEGRRHLGLDELSWFEKLKATGILK